jgi:hypothetical protein
MPDTDTKRRIDCSHLSIVYRRQGVSWGEESAFWCRWVERFQRLAGDEESDVRRIGEAGLAYATAQREEALRKERHEAV